MGLKTSLSAVIKALLVLPYWRVVQNIRLGNVGLFSGTISIGSQMTQCLIILFLQPITKLHLFTIELKLVDDFRCFRSKMFFRTFSTVPLNSPILTVNVCLNTVLATTSHCPEFNNSETIDIGDRRLLMRLLDERYRRQGQGTRSTGL